MPTPRKSRVTLRDVAKVAGVSVASVSLALRKSPRVSESTRMRIARVCDELGYVKDGRLSQLMSHLRRIEANKTTASIAAVITHPDSSDSDYQAQSGGLLEAIRGEANRQGYSLFVVDMVKEGISARPLQRMLRARGIVGMVVLPSDSHAVLDGFDFSSFFAVAIGYELEEALPQRVCPNYLKMMDELMRDCMRKGHRSVAFIPEKSQRLLRDRILWSSIDYHLMETVGARRAPVFEGTLEDVESLRGWLSVCRPDLILGSRRAYERLVQMGYEMPEDFSFAAWDVQGLPDCVAGLDTRPDLLGVEALREVVEGINRNEYGLSKAPGIVVVNSEYRPSKSLAFVRSQVDEIGA